MSAKTRDRPCGYPRRVHRRLHVLVGPLLSVISLAGCTSSSGSAATTATAATAAVTSSVGPGGPVDCAAAKTALGASIVNWQMVAQLGTETDVSKWAARTNVVGSLSSFGSQLDALQAQVGTSAGVAAAIQFMRGAHTIVQRGLAGDATAPNTLASYLGTDVTGTLNRPTPIGQAVAAAGC